MLCPHPHFPQKQTAQFRHLVINEEALSALLASLFLLSTNQRSNEEALSALLASSFLSSKSKLQMPASYDQTKEIRYDTVFGLVQTVL